MWVQIAFNDSIELFFHSIMLKKVIWHITLVTKLYILKYQQKKRGKCCSMFPIFACQEQNIEKGLRQFITNKNIAVLLKSFECTRVE